MKNLFTYEMCKECGMVCGLNIDWRLKKEKDCCIDCNLKCLGRVACVYFKDKKIF